VGMIEGLDEAIAELHEMDAAAKDATPILREIAEGAASEMRQHFQAQQSSQGGTFKALSPGYAARKAKGYPGKTILRATDQMFSSIVANSGPDFAEAGPTDEKARYHSSPEPRAKMPLRDPFFVDPDSEQEAAEAFADYVGPR
jgi:phage gpG-like protein